MCTPSGVHTHNIHNTPTKHTLYILALQSRARLEILFPQLLCYCYGSTLSKKLKEAIGYLEEYRTWSQLSPQDGPSMWPKKTTKNSSRKGIKCLSQRL